MIVSDTHRLVFVHVPKCAGTLVTWYLAPYDERAGARPDGGVRDGGVRDGVVLDGVAPDPVLGTVDHRHLPLFVLREHRPELYAKIRAYRAYALVRDPFDRFASAFGQHVRMYRDAPLHELTPERAAVLVDEVVAELEGRSAAGAWLPYTHVHFQRQVDYVEDGGERLVDRLYDVARVADLVRDAFERLGEAPPDRLTDAPAARNANVVYRGAAVRWLADRARPLARRWLGHRARVRTVDALRGVLFRPPADRFAPVFERPHVRDFVAWYYQADIELHGSLAGEGAT